MKRMLYLTCIVAGASFIGACGKSVERAQRDVQRAHDQAVQDVHRKQQDLKETQQEATERIARQERRVEDAARKGNEQILQEQRQLEDAKRAEARRETNDATTDAPRINDRSSLDNDRRPARLDINVNRGSDGVLVDVNRNP